MAVFPRLSRKIRARVGQNANDPEAGQGLAEYALILGLIAALCVGALSALGTGISASGAWNLFAGG